MIFEDRRDAGRRLAARLGQYRGRAIVLALPRGGVVVGAEVARALAIPLDVIVARKLGAPQQPELGIGAIAPGGVMVLDEERAHWLGVSDDALAAVVARESVEMERRLRQYRGDRLMSDLIGRTVILVDDGLATGVTARAAIVSVRARSPHRVVLAVPVCPGDAVSLFREIADEVISLQAPQELYAVGYWYREFGQTTDAEVIALLNEHRQAPMVENEPAAGRHDDDGEKREAASIRGMPYCSSARRTA